MRRKKFRNNGKMQEAQEQIEEQNRIRREILQYTQELAEEINLRLLLDQEENLLFLESIAVTEICFPKPQKKPGFLTRIGKKVTEIFIRIRNYIR